jgi:Alpha/beta hydrolase of unknown function (DUF1023).
MGRPDVLFDVTAFLSPTIAAGLVGALGMSPAVPPVTSATIADALARPAIVATVPGPVGVDAGTPQPFIGPDPVGGGQSLDAIARFDGVALLDQLVRLSPTARSEFVGRYPEAIAELTASPPSAVAAAKWWARTAPAARTALAADLPGVVGNLEGVPYGVRDSANRALLASTVSGIRAQLDAGVGRAMEDELRARLRMLTAVEDALRPGASGERHRLVSLDVEGTGRAVVVIGDLESADFITFFVPGMYIGVADQLGGWTEFAETSLVEQTEWLDRLGMEGEVATVAWIGYHTPTLVNVSSMDLAYEGRDALTASLQGLATVNGGLGPFSTQGGSPAGTVSGAISGAGRVAGAVPGSAIPSGTLEPGDGRPYVTVVAHSYGSTAAMLALQQNPVSVDALVVVGSPGSPVGNVADLKVPGGNVWVGAADTDPVPTSGVFGSQPLDADFGAKRFSVRATVDPITGEQLDDITGHVYYFWPGTTSVRNTALIAIGHGALATTDGAVTRAAAR